ncbi:MAG: ISKra4 family transposase, partial [Terriglobia bacterium]
MKQEYNRILQLEEFAAAAEQWGKLLIELTSKRLMQAQHSDVEEHLKKEGAELLRLVFQGQLDLRAENEEKLENLIGSDGRVRNHRRDDCTRPLMTIFGEVTVSRIGYSARGTTSLFPMDSELNLPTDQYSHGLRRLMAEEIAHVSYDEAVASVQRTTAGKVPKLQAEKLVAEVAKDFEAFYKANRVAAPERTADPLILSFDGKGIVMRHDSLREQTKKAAEREEHKLETRLSKGEKANRKRMATVATVYDVEKNVRTAEEIMCSNDEERKAKPKPPRARNKRVWASVEREAKEVIREAVEEALRRDPRKKRPWVILVDGHEQQLKNISGCLHEHGGTEASFILDFIHVLEYLWKAAYCFNPEGSVEAEEWVGERALNILNGSAQNVAAGISRSATMRKLSKSAREPADTCARYLLKHASMMQYYKYLDRGFPIATGVIEGACRHLIKDRLDITGARWSLHGAEAVLKLRSLKSSHDLDVYWSYHKEREHQRNH